jgi:hypothetical protein
MVWTQALPTTKGHLLEMSSLPPLQCLFCNHLNPAGAIFCNTCGSQMHLQPCDRCGAINKRTARKCYKCSAGFNWAAAPELDAVTTPFGKPLAASLEHDIEPNIGLDMAHTPQPSAVALRADELNLSTPGATATRSRRRWRMAAAVILLIAVVTSGNYYSERSVEFTKTQGVIPFAPRVSPAPLAAGAVPSTIATPHDAASTATGTAPKLAAGTASVAAALSLAPPVARAATAVRPTPATKAEVKPPQDVPISKECVPAVAALGLCNPSTKQEE